MRFLTFASLSLASAIAAVNAAEIFSCTEPNTIALTFDDGPFQYTEKLLKQLKTKNIHATFFINGNNWWGELAGTPNEKIIAKIAADGHQIASHTYNHKIPSTNEERAADFKKMEDLIEKNAGFRPTYFRAPRGECDEACMTYIESLGYKIINWDTDTNDWNYAQFQSDPNSEDPVIVNQAKDATVEEVKKYLTAEFSQKRPNYLVLMHDVHNHTVQKIIPWLLQNLPEGYRFVTVAECLGDKTLGRAGGNGASISPSTNGNENQNASIPKSATVPGNSTQSLLINSKDSTNTSDGYSIISNIYLMAALLVYSLYMIF